MIQSRDGVAYNHMVFHMIQLAISKNDCHFEG